MELTDKKTHNEWPATKAMCCRLIFMVIGFIFLFPDSGHTKVRPVISISPFHFHQLPSYSLAGIIGLGIGVEIDEKWAVDVSWELNMTTLIPTELSTLDTNRVLDIFTLEFVREFRFPRPKLGYLRTGINTGLGVEWVRAYEYADSATTYSDRAISQRLLSATRENQAFVGIVVGFTVWLSGVWIGVDYRPKLYGLGDENAFVHSGGLTLRFPLGSP